MEHKYAVTPRSEEEKEKVLKRLKRIEGQVRGIQKMIEDDRYCIDILIQISAIESALKQVGFSVTERHMNHCVSDAIRKGEGEESIAELMKVLRQFGK
ncbi:transcriptional regulator [Macrococcus hajekii]|uniref:Transcriptional regulator n=1 Tax=Macrococcus hajekii TaxID=198482 RepID=A0A4R6BJ96_9STAP|nr:metal-sensing transcriptional repressor [Macrococcus hajekii]TDM01769.1 transcriptional regulator [Macrococcus hajekii]GGB07287.1 transcriptional regulator [Macrococcus hajekii]